MNFLLAALIMGLAGSLHCAGMCGPLISIMPYDRSSRLKFIKTKTLNHLGRIFTYATLGLVIGLVGETAAAMGFQQALSIIAGTIILFALIIPKKWNPFSLAAKSMGWVATLKQKFSIVLQKQNASALFVLGVLNGLLPCGLVYIALAGALATGDVLTSVLFMVIFGLGTTPVLVMIGTFATQIRKKTGPRFLKIARVMAIGTSLLLILRGSNLGIPYVSPKVVAETCEMDCCH